MRVGTTARGLPLLRQMGCDYFLISFARYFFVNNDNFHSSDRDDGAYHRARPTGGRRRDMSSQMSGAFEDVLGGFGGRDDGEPDPTTVDPAPRSAAGARP